MRTAITLCQKCGTVYRHALASYECDTGVTHTTERCRDVLATKLTEAKAALVDALEGLQDMRGYITAYFAQKHGHDGYIERARKALGRTT